MGIGYGLTPKFVGTGYGWEVALGTSTVGFPVCGVLVALPGDAGVDVAVGGWVPAVPGITDTASNSSEF